MDDVGPRDLTDDEIAAMVSILQPVWDRIQALPVGVVDLDLVRSRAHWRR
jgi:hypothetical protein